MTIFPLCRALFCTLLLIISWTAQATLNLSDPLPLSPLVKVGKLENGLTYYIQKNSKPEKHAELRLVIKVGSILEDDDQQGLAHFLEHMAFNGSTHFKKHELISYLQSLGIKFGADLNAYTSFDETVYILPIPIDSGRGNDNLKAGFLVLEDWAHGLMLNEVDIDAERNIILEEARLGKGAEDRMNRKLLPALFNGSKYAERLPIGKESVISHFNYDALRRFYKEWYRPDLMAVVVVGDVDPDKVEKLVKTHFSHLKNPPNERPRVYASIPARTESASLVITDKEAMDNEQLIQYPIHSSKKEVTLADYRHSLIKNLSADMLNQRIQELTQQTDAPFLAGGSAIRPIVHGHESFSSIAVIGRASVKPAIEALLQENQRARQFGFNADELQRAKKNQLRFFESAYNERNKSESASFAAEYIRHFLSDEAIPGIANEYAYATEFLPQITLEEINDYAKNNIPNGAAKLLAYLGSDKEVNAIPTAAQLVDWATASEQLPVTAKDNKTVPRSLMTQSPRPGRIVSEKKNDKLGITTLTLSNGINVILKPTNFKSDQVLLSSVRFGGQSLFEDADIFNARYSNAVVDSMGLASYTPTELQKILAGKSVFFQASSNNFTENLTGYASTSDVESLLQIVHLRLAKPRLDSDLYKAFISRMQDISKNLMAKPELLFSNTLLTTLYNNNPRVSLTAQPDDFNHITMERAAAIFSDRFTSAKGFTFILVGSINLDKIKPLIATYLASLSTTEILTTYRNLKILPVPGIVKREVHSGSEEKSRLAIVFTGPASYSDEENIRFNALIEVMNLRVIDVLREKLGLIYSGGMSGAIEQTPYQNYRLTTILPCSPEKVDKVIAAAFSEIEKIKKEGPTAEELNKVKINWRKNNNIALNTNEHWLKSLQSAMLYNTNPSNILSVERRIAHLTSDDVKDAAARYLNTGNYVQVVLYPEK
ncbi:MAG: insulinase family protein [Solimicrobium sp.]|nr:insulinase family protein [Solimicrobium sp.]